VVIEKLSSVFTKKIGYFVLEKSNLIGMAIRSGLAYGNESL